MRLHEATWLNRAAKRLAPPLSRMLCSPLLLDRVRAFDAYLNFLLGKGSGVGWDMEEEIAAARALIRRPDPVVFDIGANVGTWTQGLLAAIPGATVFMFEPSVQCWPEIERRGFTTAELIRSAVGEQAGKAKLHISSDFDHSASLHSRGDSYCRDNDYREVEIDVTTIDDFMAVRGIERVDYVKMDIEGHELFALHGARRALEERRIGAFAFEFGTANVNSHTFFRDFWQFLTEAGFRVSRITPGGRLLPVDQYYEDYEYFRSVSNYVAELRDSPRRG